MNNTKQYPTWLVPLDLAKELKEIGFDKFNFSVYNNDPYIGDVLKELSFYLKDVSKSVIFKTTNWEQAFEWFRARGYYGNLEASKEGTSAYIYTPTDFGTSWEFSYRQTYEEAREALLLKLIEIYKINELANQQIDKLE